MKYLGRKGTMAISTLLTGFSLFLFTISPDPWFQTLASSIQALFSVRRPFPLNSTPPLTPKQNVSYGALYAYTPEVLPAPIRSTGSGIASLFNRIAGLTAPLLAAVLPADVPIRLAGAMYVVAFIAMCLLPIETRGMESL